jgi:hypothetical protein
MAGPGVGQPRPATPPPPKVEGTIIDNIEELIRLDKEIGTAEERSDDNLRHAHRARWDFGQLMLAARGGGKKLPTGYLDELAQRTGRSRADLGHRMAFAAAYPTEEALHTAVCNADGTCKPWREVRRGLPAPPEAKPRKPRAKPAQPPARSKKAAEIIELAERGKSRQQIAAATGETDRTVRRELELDVLAKDAAPVAWDTIPGPQRARLERAKASIRRELEREFRTRLLAEVDQHRAKLDADFAAYKAQQDAQNQAMRAMRDEERKRYQEGIEVQRAKGLITPDDYNLVRSCLHPDSRASVTDEKLAAAFRVFNDSRIKTLLVKER